MRRKQTELNSNSSPGDTNVHKDAFSPPQTQQRQISKRWNGNYKHASKKLCDVPKRKKLKLELTAPNGEIKTVVKTKEETLQHSLVKAMIWVLFMDEYPNIEIEYDIGDPNYLPDVVSLPLGADDDDDDSNQMKSEPFFWGESGRMKVHKAVDIMQRYPHTHFVQIRWGMSLDTFVTPVEEYLQQQFDVGKLDLRDTRTAPYTFGCLPYDVWKYIDEETMTINITKDDVQWKELEFPSQISDSFLLAKQQQLQPQKQDQKKSTVRTPKNKRWR